VSSERVKDFTSMALAMSVMLADTSLSRPLNASPPSELSGAACSRKMMRTTMQN
jgi:hypothetical protein